MDRRPIVAADPALVGGGAMLTARGIVAAAKRAGYDVRTQRVVMRRTPRLARQAEEWIIATHIAGVAGRWSFLATHNERDDWEVIQHRPGWPVSMSNVTALRAMLKAQTPAVLR